MLYRLSMSNVRPVTPGWHSVGLCWDGEDFDLEGINPWHHEWASQAERIVVAHPSYPTQRHDADVWTIHTSDRVIKFAAGEMSNLAWAFFLPDSQVSQHPQRGRKTPPLRRATSGVSGRGGAILAEAVRGCFRTCGGVTRASSGAWAAAPWWWPWPERRASDG